MVNAQALKRLKKVSSYSGTISAGTLDITDSAVVVGDIIFAAFSASTTAVAVQKAICSTNGTISLTFSGTPGASSVINYMILTGGN